MADTKGIVRLIKVVFDRASGQKAQNELAESLKQAGAKGGDNFLREMRAAYAKATAALKEQLAKGEISAKKYNRELAGLDKQFNQGLIANIARLRDESRLTDREFVKLTGSLKRVGNDGAGAFAKIGASLKSMVGGFVAGFGLYQVTGLLRESLDAANELEASNRKLAATAKITGTELGYLQQEAAKINAEFKLGPSLANDLTIELAKLATKAGDIGKATPGMAAFLDLGAARGLDAAATLQAVRQAILGIDEGTDKLFGKNPSVIYAEFAAKIGTVAAKLTDQQKAQAILNAAIEDGGKVRGEYSKWLESAAGKQFLFNQQILQAKQRVGQELQPAIIDALPGLTSLVELFGKLSVFLVKISETPLNNILALLKLFTNPGEALREENDRAIDTWRRRLGMAPRVRAGAAPLEPTVVLPPPYVPYKPPPPEPETDAERKARLAREEKEREELAERERLNRLFRARQQPFPVKSAAELAASTGQGELGAAVQFATPEMLAENVQAAEDFVSPWEDAMRKVEDIFTKEGGIIGDLADALAEGGIKGLGKYAIAKVKENIAAAIEMGAMALGRLVFGDPVGAAAAGKAAAGHAAAAAAWQIAAAGMGGGGSSASAGLAAGLGGVGNPGGGVASGSEAGAEIHVHFVGPGFSAVNPEVQRVVAGAIQEHTDRNGPNAKVYVHRSAR